ncbi:hypothetical protein BHE90_010091 [Fusarium euwallaceae]|uniref:Uncharacterized protein n=1 Tax=Fusarium euwallaceae TaxID=1147111 RepID=A0A430LIA8_9HYPO|nr:hypothetical protein BHE90_010091 [Fusarium euwallaceae]
MADSSFGVVDKNSPRMEPFHPTIKPSPSTPPGIPPPKRIPSTTENHENDGTQKTHNTGGDAVLIRSLTDGRSMEMIRSADETGLPPTQGDEEEDLMKNVTIPGSQAPVKPAVKRLIETAFGASEQRDIHIGRSIRRKIVHQLDDETGDRRPNEELLTNSLKSFPLVFYTDDTSPPGEVS